jgi:hypothetical protein
MIIIIIIIIAAAAAATTTTITTFLHSAPDSDVECICLFSASRAFQETEKALIVFKTIRNFSIKNFNCRRY